MKILFNKPFRIFTEKDSIEIIPNTVNYFVGLNGCGKSVITSSLAEHVFDSFSKKKKEEQRYNWMTRPPDYIMENFRFEGFESITDISFYTAKHRQSQYVDLNMTFDHPANIGCLKISEGMNNQSEIVNAFKDKDNINKLYIFDEIDGTLDVRAKHLFFDRLLPQLKGTVIVCTHDTFFVRKQEVIDLSTNTKMSMTDYFIKYTKPLLSD